MPLFNFKRFSESQDLGIDLGTANTLIYIPGKDIVIDEPSVIAYQKKEDSKERQVIAVGTDAKRMLGRTPVNVRTERPLKDGVIKDVAMTAMMLGEFIRKVKGNTNLSRSRIIIGVPSGVTKVESDAVAEAVKEMIYDDDDIKFIDEPLAAAIGAGLPVEEPVGNMIVDIGGGTTEVAVLSLQGIVIADSVRVAGDEINKAIANYVKQTYNLKIGERTAEQIKIDLGSACPVELEVEKQEVRGLNLISSLPKTVTINAEEVREAIADTITVIVDSVKATLEKTPPELAGDIIERGIVLAGGGALIRGLDTLIANETGIITHIAPQPLKCVVYGTGKVLDEPKRFSRVFRTK